MAITAAIVGLGAAGGGFAISSAVGARKDAKEARRKAEGEINKLREDEERNRLQSAMRMQRRRGFRPGSGLRPNPALQLGSLGSGGGKTLLGL